MYDTICWMCTGILLPPPLLLSYYQTCLILRQVCFLLHLGSDIFEFQRSYCCSYSYYWHLICYYHWVCSLLILNYWLFLLKYCYYSVAIMDRVVVLVSQYNLLLFLYLYLVFLCFSRTSSTTIWIFQFPLLLSSPLIISASPILIWISFVLCIMLCCLHKAVIRLFFHLRLSAALHLKIYFHVWTFLLSRETNGHYPDYDVPETLETKFCSC